MQPQLLFSPASDCSHSPTDHRLTSATSCVVVSGDERQQNHQQQQHHHHHHHHHHHQQQHSWHYCQLIRPSGDVVTSGRDFPTDAAAAAAAAMMMTSASSSSSELSQRRQRLQRQQQLMLMRMMYSSSSSSLLPSSSGFDDDKAGFSYLSPLLPRPPRADIEAVLMSTLSSVLCGRQQAPQPSASMDGSHLLPMCSPSTAMTEMLRYTAMLPNGCGAYGAVTSPFQSVLQTKYSPAVDGCDSEQQSGYRTTTDDWKMQSSSKADTELCTTTSPVGSSGSSDLMRRDVRDANLRVIGGDADGNSDRLVSTTSG
jgi:hypothetical protein